jgi:Tol biopolymer transport system component
VCRGGSGGIEAIMALHPNGTHYHQLIDLSNESVSGVSYSPNGKRIVFGASPLGSADVFVARANGSNAHPITGGGTGYWPLWPLKNKIVFTSGDDGDNELYSITPAGMSRQQLTTNADSDETGFFT